MRSYREKGVALITALLILFLVSAIIVGMSWMVMTDQRLGGNNKDRQNAFYGAEAGMEKMTADVGTTFSTKGAVTAADITTITGAPPIIPGIQFLNAVGISTYQITPLIPVSQNATVLPPSPYSGMQALITPLTLTVASQTNDGAEVKLQRTVQVVAIPVFQFGIYSDSDLSFFAGPPFDFGGRVHTNGNLWLAANSGPLYLGDKVTVVGQVIRTNLENGWPSGTVIAAGGDYSGTVSIATTPNPPRPPYAPAQWRPLALGEGSVSGPSVYGNVSTTLNTAVWNSTTPLYNGQLANGVPILSLTSTALGGITTPISLIRRAVPGELATNPAEFSQQNFGSQFTSMRILLDDYPVAGTVPGAPGACHNADMMGLDTVTSGTDPIDLGSLAAPVGPPPSLGGWYTGAVNVPPSAIPLPVSGATGLAYSAANGYWQKAGTPLITGCIKIEIRTIAGVWTDVTIPILKFGFTGRNINPTNLTNYVYVAPPALPTLPNALTTIPASKVANQVPAQGPTTNVNVTSTIPCVDPSPNAILRLERLRDNPSGGLTGCGGSTLQGTDYWPMVLYDTREAVYRPGATPPAPNSLDPNPAQPGITGAGVIGYIELDAANLALWLKNNQGVLGINNNTGFTVYFSDRRGEQLDPSSGAVKTGSFGFNDFVNQSNAASGCPNGVAGSVPEQGEDLEGDGLLRTYGGLSITPYNVLNGMGAGPFQPNCGSTNWPGYVYNYTQEARENSPVLFRRALKIVDGLGLNLGTSCYGAAPNPPCGLTIASENPVYIQGDYNAPPDGSWGNPAPGKISVATSVAADAVTLLSDNWNDVNSFIFPYDITNRVAVPTAYRVALIAGKGIPFPQPAGQPEDFGTDGGLHNFLRFLEQWGVNGYYDGSLVSFYYNRQGVGTYKTGTYVYSPPVRNYQFDQNFTLGPQWLPPNTPVLRSINTIGFTQMLMPTQ